ncbi:MAG: hypothetical protein AAGI10_08830 [Pseudomonadota bacterium]
MQTTTVRAFAPARVCLHTWVSDTGAPIAALWAYADVGDEIRLSQGLSTVVTVSGEMADDFPPAERSAILDAVGRLGSGCRIKIDMTVRTAASFSGITTRVAAALRGAGRLVGKEPYDTAHDLGFDYSSALQPEAKLRTERGVESVKLPPLHAVLVDPTSDVADPTEADLANGHVGSLPLWNSPAEFVAWLSTQEGPNAETAPENRPDIEEALDELDLLPDCLIARVSGPGPGCFALFPDRFTADAAAMNMAALKPMWWVRSAALG